LQHHLYEHTFNLAGHRTEIRRRILTRFGFQFIKGLRVPCRTGQQFAVTDHQIISTLARKHPALCMDCRIDISSMGVAPSAFSARTTLFRLALERTLCSEPPLWRRSICVCGVTTVCPPPNGVSGWLTLA